MDQMGILAVDLDHFKTGVHSYVMRPPRPVLPITFLIPLVVYKMECDM
jgi:hypothetical protein